MQQRCPLAAIEIVHRPPNSLLRILIVLDRERIIDASAPALFLKTSENDLLSIRSLRETFDSDRSNAKLPAIIIIKGCLRRRPLPGFRRKVLPPFFRTISSGMCRFRGGPWNWIAMLLHAVPPERCERTRAALAAPALLIEKGTGKWTDIFSSSSSCYKLLGI